MLRQVFTHFGAEGVCRTSNLGFPMVEVNTARVCTRVPAMYTADPSTPTAAGAAGQAEAWQPEQCATSSRDLPWDAQLQTQRQLQSVGGVPFYRRGSAAAAEYPPASAAGVLKVGYSSSAEAAEPGFGSMCSHPALPPACTDDLQCGCGEAPSCGYKCHAKGVCVKADNEQCYSHADCLNGEMCSGQGQCVPPVIEVRNRLPADDAEFRVYTSSESCAMEGLRATDMYSASAWGRVRDALRRHGLCSHRDWVEYNMTLAKGDWNAEGGYYKFDVNSWNQSWAFTQEHEGLLHWVGQGVLHQEAHACDRDYMHVHQFVSCFPNDIVYMLEGSDTIFKQLTSHTYGSVVKPYSVEANSRIVGKLGRMPHISTDLRYGFLGKMQGITPAAAKYADFGFKKCDTDQMCTRQEFTVYGYTVDKRRVWNGEGEQDSNPFDTFRCGAYGFMIGAKCVLDLSVVPMYQVLCRELNRGSIVSKCSPVVTTNQTIQTWCDKFKKAPFNTERHKGLPTWQSDNERGRTGIVQIVNDFSALFTPVASKPPSERHTAYLQAVRCAEEIHLQLKSTAVVGYTNNLVKDAADITSGVVGGKVWAGRSLYWFSAYGLYEFPFSWFFRCWMLAGIKPLDGYARCDGWEQVLDLGSRPAMSAWDYLTRIRGGVLLPSENLTHYNHLWEGMVDAASLHSYFDGVDPSTGEVYLRCASERSIPLEVYEESRDLQEHMLQVQKNQGGVDPYWPFGLAESLCEGKSIDEVVPCTNVTKSEWKQSSVAEEARRNLKTPPQSQQDFFEYHNFMAQDMQMGDSIPVFQLAQVRVNSFGKISSMPLPSVKSSPQQGTCVRVKVTENSFSRVAETSTETTGGAYLWWRINQEVRAALDDPLDAQASPYITVAYGGEPAKGGPLFRQVYRSTRPLPKSGGHIAKQVYECPKSVCTMTSETKNGLTFAEQKCTGINILCKPPHAAASDVSGHGAVFWNLVADKQEDLFWTDSGAKCGLKGSTRTQCLFGANCAVSMLDLGELKVKNSTGGFVSDWFLRSEWASFNDDITVFLPIGVYLQYYQLKRKVASNPHSVPDWIEGIAHDIYAGQPTIQFSSPQEAMCPDSRHKASMQLHSWWASWDDLLQSESQIKKALALIERHCPPIQKLFWMPLFAGTLYGQSAVYSEDCIRSWYLYSYVSEFNGIPVDGSETNQDYIEYIVMRDQSTRTKLAFFFQKPYLTNPYLWASPGHNYQDMIAQDPLRQAPATLGEEPLCPASDTGISLCKIPQGGLNSFRIGLLENYTFSEDYCKQSQKYAVPVQLGLYKCLPRVWFQPLYCRGTHGCKAVLSDRGDRTYIGETSTGLPQGELEYDEAVHQAMYFLANEILLKSGGAPLVNLPVQNLSLFDDETAVWNQQRPFERFDSTGSQRFEDELPPLLGGTGMRCTGAYSNVVDWNKCNFDDGYNAFRDLVRTHLKQNESLVVPAGKTAVFHVPNKLLLEGGIPAWSNKSRDLEQTFLDKLANATYQCRQAKSSLSICSEHVDSLSGNRSLYVFNPWLGGAFNVLEGGNVGGSEAGCDTNLLDILDMDGGGFNPEYISTLCDSSLAACRGNPSLLDATTAGVCRQRQNKAPEYRVMPPFTNKHNLCTQRPPSNPQDCTHPQGMLQGLQGVQWPDLYKARVLDGSDLPDRGVYRSPFFLGQVHILTPA